MYVETWNSTTRCGVRACVCQAVRQTDREAPGSLRSVLSLQTDVRSVAPGSVAISDDLAPRYPTITDNVMLLTLTDNTVLDL